MFVLSAIIAQKYIVYGQGPIACHCYRKTGESLCYSHTQRIDVNQDSEQNLDLPLSWLCQHGLLKEGFAHMQ